MFKKIYKTLLSFAYCVGTCLNVNAQQESSWRMQPVQIQTRWAKDVKPEKVLPEYPRPQMVRNEWQNLNGLWEYTIVSEDAGIPNKFDGQILVPFPVESALSGVKRPLLPNQLLWYKRTVTKPDIKGGKRILLHFGAVDYQATVFINGKEIGKHTGGYQNFSFDVTDELKAGTNELRVKVWDPTDQGPNPHGKQVLTPQNIMYTATSGIWQTVWLEVVPAVYISRIVMTPSIDSNHLRLSVQTMGDAKDCTIEVVASDGSSAKGKPHGQLILHMNNVRPWSPEDPYLYNLNVRLLRGGQTIDTVGSYFGMRKIEVKSDSMGIMRLFLNNKYTYHLGVLDQGFWPEGLYTAPTDEALEFDILAIRNMGYNAIRKHIKIEPARWYYHADKAGMLVWQDMVTCAGSSPEARIEFESENKVYIAQLHNYPSIVIWVLFNEGWARYDQQRLTEWLKKEDPSRVINGHSGENYDGGSPQNPLEKWASSDITDIHDYPGPDIAPSLPGKARVLGEWGGIRVPTPKHQWNGSEGWGYIQVTPAEFVQKYEFMLKHLTVYEEEGLSGSIYTEPFDVETEENGMMSYDREVIKIPAEKLRQIHRSLVPAAERFVWNSFKAKTSDTANSDHHYSTLLRDYKTGKRDSGFLRDLAMMALRLNDKPSAHMIADDYIRRLINPYSKNELDFIVEFTRRSSDPGFNIFLKNPEKVNGVLGKNRAEFIVREIIGREEIQPFLDNKTSKPDWDEILSTVKGKYGKLGVEKVYGAQMVYYLDNKDWLNFGKYYVLYYETAYDRSEYHINNMSWSIFEHSNDSQVLAVAIKTMKHSIENFDQKNYEAYDTYANLLYRIGRRQDAIAWQKKAVKALPNNREIARTLIKMEEGKPTWEKN